MKNGWLYFYTGIVTVKVSGSGLERFINLLIRSGVQVWNVKRHGTEALTLQMTLKDAKRIRHFVRNSGCKIEFLKRTGLPFLFKTLLKNSGFLIGGVLFVALIFVLSNMVWGIEITGAAPATEHKIRKELDKIGVKVGTLQFLLDEPEAIQRAISADINEITWIGVELQGTTYHLQVVEKNEPEKPETLGPQHLIALKKAVIVNMFIEEGQAKVEVNDHVVEGQLLVSGEIGKEGETKLVPAKGEVLGETWYKSDVSLPLQTKFQVFNGNEEEKYYVKIGTTNIPVWGFKSIPFKQFEKDTDETRLRFLKWELPFTFVHETYRESEITTKAYTEKEAIDVALEIARKDIKSQLPVDATIKGEKVLHQTILNGKVDVTIHFQVIENIAKAYPLIQGELE